MSLNKDFEIILAPGRGWFQIDWAALWAYRDLLYFLVRREFIAKYKQTVLGPAWFIFQPVLTTGVFTLVFGRMAQMPTDQVPPALFYFCALVPWAYFSQSLSAISLSLVTHATIFEKVYFPRLVIPLATLISNLFSFFLQMAVFLIGYAYIKFFTPSGALLDARMFLVWLPLLLLQTMALSLGIGLLIASLTAKYRDFQHLTVFMVQLWMFATPIIYPLSMARGHFRILLLMNPMTTVVEGWRFAFFGTGVVNPTILVCGFVASLLIVVIGLGVFSRAERTFVDTI